MSGFIISLVSFIVTLGILVAVHEWGHFWVARRCGVKVERFSIGFGKKLWSRTDKLGTEYVIAAIPLGGYVKMLDERVEQVKEADLPMAFNRQPVLKRIAIIAAGPGVNFLFAILVLSVMYMIGQQSVKPVLSEPTEQSIAAKAGIHSGMIITQVGGRETRDWEAVNYELISFIGEDSIELKVDTGKGYFDTITLDTRDWQYDQESQSAFSSLGIKPFRPNITPKLSFVGESDAGGKAGLQVGDIILSLDGTSYQNWEQIVKFIEQRPNQDVVIGIERNGMDMFLNATIGQITRNNKEFGYLGVGPSQEPWPEAYLFEQQYGPIDAVVQGSARTWRLMTLSVEMIGKLFTGDVSVSNLSGPISIAQGAGMSASYGLVSFLGFLALISVNLGIINLFPLPVLDGGHLLYYFIEFLTGRPVPESVQEVGFKIGGIALLLLMTVAIFNDIARL